MSCPTITNDILLHCHTELEEDGGELYCPVCGATEEEARSEDNELVESNEPSALDIIDEEL